MKYLLCVLLNVFVFGILSGSSASAEGIGNVRHRWDIGGISIKEAKDIQRILEIASRPNSELALAQLYRAYADRAYKDGELLRFVALEQLEKKKRLDLLSDVNDPLVRFSLFLEQDVSEAIKYMKSLEDPIESNKLAYWRMTRKGFEVYPESRQYRVLLERNNLKVSMEGMNDTVKIRFLFKSLKEFKEVLRYEASLTIFRDLYIRQPELVRSFLREEIQTIELPTNTPPPYSTNHTVYIRICQLSIVLGDDSLIDDFKKRALSKEPYESHLSTYTVKWLQSGLAYPWNYESAAHYFYTEG